MKNLKMVSLGSFLCGLVVFMLMGAAVGTKISDYPNTATAANTDLFLLARPGVTNYNQQYQQLSAQLRTNNVYATNVWDNAGNSLFYLGSQDLNGISNSWVIGNGGRLLSTNAAVGDPYGPWNAQEDLFIGWNAGLQAVSNQFTTFIGYRAGENSIGGQNTAVGSQAGWHLTTGDRNTFFSYGAGQAVTTGSRNCIIGGDTSLILTNGNDNTVLGTQAGPINSASANTCVGTYAGQATTANENTFLGFESGVNITSGSCNTFLGAYSGLTNITGSSNLVAGCRAFSLEGVHNSIALGCDSVATRSYQAVIGTSIITNTDLYGHVVLRSDGNPALTINTNVLVVTNNAIGIGSLPSGSYKLEVNGSSIFRNAIFAANGVSLASGWQVNFNSDGTANALILANSGSLCLFSGARPSLTLPTDETLVIPVSTNVPAAPAANYVKIYSVTNLAGKIVVAAKFSDNSTNAFATQP